MVIGNQEIQIIILGTLGMIILSLGIIVFFVLYQRKIQKQKIEFDRKELDYQKKLVASQIAYTEMERKRIAQELHDEIGSSLTSIKMSLASLEMADDNRFFLEKGLNGTIQNVRRISSELLPPILEELGLVSATQSLVRRLAKNEEIKISYRDESSDHKRYDKKVELAVYRVIQELLNNIIKYSHCSAINIHSSYTANKVAVLIEDNGDGFEPSDENKNKADSHGLKNIYSRIQDINGEIKFEKLTKGGTKTTIIKHLEHEH